MSKQQRLAKRMRLTARVIGLVASGFWLISLITSGIFEALAGDWEAIVEIEGILLVVFAAIALAVCVVSWWRERLAGILLVLIAIGFGAYSGAIAGRNHIIVGLMIGLPYLIAGVLLLYSWRLSRKIA